MDEVKELVADGWKFKTESYVGIAPFSGLLGKTYYMASLQKDYVFIREYAATEEQAVRSAVGKVLEHK